MSNVIDIRQRFSIDGRKSSQEPLDRIARARTAALDRFWSDFGRHRQSVEVVHYERAAIHEAVPIAQLVAALNRAGLTVTNLPGLGLVIHRIGDSAERPAGSLDAS